MAILVRMLVITIIGWTGARCEADVDECALGLVSCGPGRCRNLAGSYVCECAAGLCGLECALADPCAAGAGAGGAGNGSGPCARGRCEQRCAAEPAFLCHCDDGWAGALCDEEAVSAASEGGGGAPAPVLWAVGAALVALAALGAALAALGAQARRKRATRGTYSPSGQEYCNPRHEMMHNALKPPPEERLI